MSRLCRLKSYQGIGDDGVWASAEITMLRQQLAEVTERLEQVCIGAREELRKRLDAESGYEAISERLYTAPVALMDTRTALAVCALREEDFPALYALQGKRVRIVVEDEGEK